jgi:hypothetical protein
LHLTVIIYFSSSKTDAWRFFVGTAPALLAWSKKLEREED